MGFAFYYLSQQNAISGDINPVALEATNNVVFGDRHAALFPLISYEKNTGEAQFSIHFDQAFRGGTLFIEASGRNELWRNNITISAQAYYKNSPITSWLLNSSIALRPNEDAGFRLPLALALKDRVDISISYTGHNSGLDLSKFAMQATELNDFPIMALLNIILVGLLLFLPGALLANALPITRVLPLGFNAFVYSLILALISLLLEWQSGWRGLGVVFYLAMPVLLLLPAVNRQRLAESISGASRGDIQLLTCSLVIAFLLCCCIAYGYPSPLHNIYQQHIVSDYTYHAFVAHDSEFQYANARAILEQDFAKYYGHSKLIYHPQDREILPGLAYAAVLKNLQWLVPASANAYFNYVIYYMLAHGLVLLAIYHWLRPWGWRLATLCVMAIATTPFFMVMFAVGWFKLTGVALTIVALWVIRERGYTMGSFIIAGLLLGVAKNYHGGSVLILPLLLIWMAYIGYKQHLSRWLIARNIAVLCACVVALMMPWSWFVKTAWNKQTINLFTDHFLGGHMSRYGLLHSIQLFFADIPLSEQLPVRLHRLIQAFDPSWYFNKFQAYSHVHRHEIIGYLRTSGSYVFIGFVPFVMIGGAARIYAKMMANPMKAFAGELTFRQAIWFRYDFIIAMVGLIGITFAFYNPKQFAAISWHFPWWLVISAMIGAMFTDALKYRLVEFAWWGLVILQSALILKYL